MNGISVDGSNLFVKVSGGNYTEEELVSRKEAGEKIVLLEELPPSFDGCPIRFVDRDAKNDNKWRMFGGNYITTSDNRFSVKYPYPISIHDRIEG